MPRPSMALDWCTRLILREMPHRSPGRRYGLWVSKPRSDVAGSSMIPICLPASLAPWAASHVALLLARVKSASKNDPWGLYVRVPCGTGRLSSPVLCGGACWRIARGLVGGAHPRLFRGLLTKTLWLKEALLRFLVSLVKLPVTVSFLGQHPAQLQVLVTQQSPCLCHGR